jgi:hypothetical protein
MPGRGAIFTRRKMCSSDVRSKQPDPPARGRSDAKESQVFFFLRRRQAANPAAPNPVPKSAKVAGSGTETLVVGGPLGHQFGMYLQVVPAWAGPAPMAINTGTAANVQVTIFFFIFSFSQKSPTRRAIQMPNPTATSGP